MMVTSEDVEYMEDAVSLVEIVFGMDEREAIGYVVDRVLTQMDPSGSDLLAGLISIGGVLGAARELMARRREREERERERERERIEAEDIRKCGLCRRTENSLLLAGVKTISEALELGPEGLMEIGNIGPKSVDEILAAADRMLAERSADA